MLDPSNIVTVSTILFCVVALVVQQIVHHFDLKRIKRETREDTIAELNAGNIGALTTLRNIEKANENISDTDLDTDLARVHLVQPIYKHD